MPESAPRRRRRPRVRLCAALTFDGKLCPPADPAEAERWRGLLAVSEADVFYFDDAPRSRALLEADQADELCLLVRPLVSAGRGYSTLSGIPGAAFLPRALAWRLRRMDRTGEGCRLEYIRLRL